MQAREEGAQQRRLPDPRVAVEMHDAGLTVRPGERLEKRQLVVAADEAPARVIGERRPERLWHGHEWSSGSEYPPCRAPCHPSGADGPGARRARAAGPQISVFVQTYVPGRPRLVRRRPGKR